MMTVTIRDEQPGDVKAIGTTITTAFKPIPHSNLIEAAIVTRLRDEDALTVSLVAVKGGREIGHIAFSGVEIDGKAMGWYGLGPVAVAPDHQGKGVGIKLVREGLDRLKMLGARGCVVLGEPSFYGRFGFKADPRLRLADVSEEYFMVLPLGVDIPDGMVGYHPAFYMEAL